MTDVPTFHLDAKCVSTVSVPDGMELSITTTEDGKSVCRYFKISHMQTALFGEDCMSHVAEQIRRAGK